MFLYRHPYGILPGAADVIPVLHYSSYPDYHAAFGLDVVFLFFIAHPLHGLGLHGLRRTQVTSRAQQDFATDPASVGNHFKAISYISLSSQGTTC